MLGRGHAFSSARSLVLLWLLWLTALRSQAGFKVPYCYDYLQHNKGLKTPRDVMCLG